MELPYVYIAPNEEDSAISSFEQYLTQARLIILNASVSEDRKREVYKIAMDCICDVVKYYEYKKKEEMLKKRDSDLSELLRELDVSNNEALNVINGVRSSLEEKKNNIRRCDANIRSSHARMRNILRIRKELEEQNKVSEEKYDLENAKWANLMLMAREQQLRMEKIMCNSPRLAKQQQEKDAISTLSIRVNILKAQLGGLRSDEERLTKEVELQTSVPLRVFMVSFAKLMLRTIEIQKKLKDSRVKYAALQAEEAERRKTLSQGDFDPLEMSFMSTDCNLTQLADRSPGVSKHTSQTIINESMESENTSLASPDIEPPSTTEEELQRAKTTAVNKYIRQQSATIGSQEDLADVTLDENVRESTCLKRNANDQRGIDIEVASVVDEGSTSMQEEEDTDMNETVDENEVSHNVFKSSEPATVVIDYEDEEMEEKEEDEINISVNEQNEGNNGDDYLDNQDERMEEIKQNGNIRIIKGQSVGKLNYPAPTLEQNNGSSNTSNVLNFAPESGSSEASQEGGSFFSNLMRGACSPVDETEDGNFDPDTALNISIHSNDPGGDFLSMIENASGKKSKDGKRDDTDGAADFSFSMFGGGGNGSGTADNDGDFAFNFGGSSPAQGTNGDSFAFNFGSDGTTGETQEQSQEFNFFGF